MGSSTFKEVYNALDNHWRWSYLRFFFYGLQENNVEEIL